MKKILLCLSFALIALGSTSCTSTGGSDGQGFYAPEPVSPVERSAKLQQGFGSVQRSGIR
ncbi:MAG: hypothetical protein P1U87_06220 [Verrucomicrobiales bacterium]|nr:hypothetical protein [Verrucomicrobiales bacterium]